uniref:Uncharacterized protein n=1 Tax=Banana bunchy top virus TaxID=12585 RepID=Q9WDD3_BBTV|nr:unknown [Banana bunchy top virus]
MYKYINNIRSIMLMRCLRKMKYTQIHKKTYMWCILIVKYNKIIIQTNILCIIIHKRRQSCEVK